MPKVLKKFLFRKTAAACPWDQWLDGRIWELTHGEDFTSKPMTFKLAARRTARLRGGELRANLDGNKLIIQFVAKPTS